MSKKHFDTHGLARQTICNICARYDLNNLSESDRKNLKLDLECGRPGTFPHKTWTRMIEESMFRLGILKPELPEIKGAIVCEPIALQPEPAGKGKDPDRIQLPLPLF